MAKPLKQVAALPIRRKSGAMVDVLLITSRDTGRWMIPKGWPIKGLTDPTAAAREAEEEAGVVGKVGKEPIGRYEYFKRLSETFELVNVAVYGLKVVHEQDEWIEKDQRMRRWMSPEEAASLVTEPALASIISKIANRKR